MAGEEGAIEIVADQAPESSNAGGPTTEATPASKEQEAPANEIDRLFKDMVKEDERSVVTPEKPSEASPKSEDKLAETSEAKTPEQPKEEKPKEPEKKAEAEQPKPPMNGARYDADRQMFICPRPDGNLAEVTVGRLQFLDSIQNILESWHDEVFKPAYQYGDGTNPGGREQAVVAMASKLGIPNPYELAKAESQPLQEIDPDKQTDEFLKQLGYSDEQVKVKNDPAEVAVSDLFTAQTRAEMMAAKRGGEIAAQRRALSERDQNRTASEQRVNQQVGELVAKLTQTAPIKGTGLKDTPETREAVRVFFLSHVLDGKSEQESMKVAVNQVAALVSMHQAQAAMTRLKPNIPDQPVHQERETPSAIPKANASDDAYMAFFQNAARGSMAP